MASPDPFGGVNPFGLDSATEEASDPFGGVNPFGVASEEAPTEALPEQPQALPLRELAPRGIPSHPGIKASVDAPPLPEQEVEPDFSLANWGRGIAGRASGLLGNFANTVSATAGAAEDWLGSLGGIVYDEEGLRWLGGDEYKAALEGGKVDDVFDTAQRFYMEKSEDSGYVPQYTWESVKDSDGIKELAARTLGFIAEQGVVSTPDMAAMIINTPAYVAARSGEIGRERAEFKGKDEVEFGDIVEAAPTAALIAVLERFGMKGFLGGSGGGIASQVGKATAKEAISEAAEEGIEYTGARIGTPKGIKLGELGDVMAAGAVAGGGFGAAGRLAAGVLGDLLPQDQTAQATQGMAGDAEAAAVNTTGALPVTEAELEAKYEAATRDEALAELAKRQRELEVARANPDITDTELEVAQDRVNDAAAFVKSTGATVVSPAEAAAVAATGTPKPKVRPKPAAAPVVPEALPVSEAPTQLDLFPEQPPAPAPVTAEAEVGREGVAEEKTPPVVPATEVPPADSFTDPVMQGAAFMVEQYGKSVDDARAARRGKPGPRPAATKDQRALLDSAVETTVGKLQDWENQGYDTAELRNVLNDVLGVDPNSQTMPNAEAAVAKRGGAPISRGESKAGPKGGFTGRLARFRRDLPLAFQKMVETGKNPAQAVTNKGQLLKFSAPAKTVDNMLTKKGITREDVVNSGVRPTGGGAKAPNTRYTASDLNKVVAWKNPEQAMKFFWSNKKRVEDELAARKITREDIVKSGVKPDVTGGKAGGLKYGVKALDKVRDWKYPNYQAEQAAREGQQELGRTTTGYEQASTTNIEAEVAAARGEGTKGGTEVSTKGGTEEGTEGDGFEGALNPYAAARLKERQEAEAKREAARQLAIAVQKKLAEKKRAAAAEKAAPVAPTEAPPKKTATSEKVVEESKKRTTVKTKGRKGARKKVEVVSAEEAKARAAKQAEEAQKAEEDTTLGQVEEAPTTKAKTSRAEAQKLKRLMLITIKGKRKKAVDGLDEFFTRRSSTGDELGKYSTASNLNKYLINALDKNDPLRILLQKIQEKGVADVIVRPVSTEELTAVLEYQGDGNPGGAYISRRYGDRAVDRSIALNEDLFNNSNMVQTIAHEMTHAVTAEGLTVDNDLALQMESLRQEAAAAAEAQGLPQFYGFTNVDEFVAEAFTDPTFQKFLAEVRRPGAKSLWQRFVRAVGNYLGIDASRDTLLAEVLSVGEQLFITDKESIARRTDPERAQTISRAMEDAVLEETLKAAIDEYNIEERVSSKGYQKGSLENLRQKVNKGQPGLGDRLFVEAYNRGADIAELIGDLQKYLEQQAPPTEAEMRDMMLGSEGKGEPYSTAPDSLMGFRKDPGRNIPSDQTSYKHREFVHVTWPDGGSIVDEMRGLNKPHTLERARRNWPGAKVEAITEAEARALDPHFEEDFVSIKDQVDADMRAWNRGEDTQTYASFVTKPVTAADTKEVQNVYASIRQGTGSEAAANAAAKTLRIMQGPPKKQGKFNLTDLRQQSFRGVLNVSTTDQIIRRFRSAFAGRDKNPLVQYDLAKGMKLRVATQGHEKGERINQARREFERKQPGKATLTYRLMLDATEKDTHPDIGFFDKANEHLWRDPATGRRKPLKDVKRERGIHRALSKAYQDIGPQGRKLYQDMRKYLQDQRAEKRAAGLQMILDVHGGREAFGDAAYDEVLAAKTPKDIDTIEFEDVKDANGRIRDAMTNIVSLTSVKGPYFPLRRFGDYVVEGNKETQGVTGPFGTREEALKSAQEQREQDFTSKFVTADRDGNWYVDKKQRVVTMHESKKDADNMVTHLEGEEFSGVNGADLTVSKKRDWAQAGMDKALGPAFGQALSKFKTGTAEYRALETALIELLVENSERKSELRRKGVEGASEDMGRVFAERAYAGSWSLADIKTAAPLRAAYSEMDRRAIGNLDLLEVVQKLRNRDSQDLKNRTITKIESGVTKLGFLWYLFSPAYSIYNATQPAMVTQPVLASKFGQAKATAALFRSYQGVLKAAAKEVAQVKGGVTGDAENVLDRVMEQLAPDERRAIQELVERKIIDATLVQNLFESSQGGADNLATRGWEKTMDVARTVPQAVEVVNRVVTARAAYALAIDANMSHEAAVDYAADTVRRSQFEYSDQNKPPLFRYPGARVIMMFKMFGQGMTALLAGSIYNAAKGKTKRSRREGRKLLTGLLINHTLAAGVAGGLLLEPIRLLMWMIEGLADDEDDPLDLEHMINEQLVSLGTAMVGEELGPKLGSAMWGGLPRLAGVDMLPNVGLNNLLWMGGRESRTYREAWANNLASAGGPVVAAGLNMASAMDELVRGEPQKAFEKAMPKLIKSLSQAQRFSDEGVTSFTGDVILQPDDFDSLDAFYRGIGISPAVVSRTYEGRTAQQSRMTKLRDRRRNLMMQFRRSDNPVEFFQNEIMEFNYANPQQMIMPKDLYSSMQDQAMREAMMRAGYPSDPRQDIKAWQIGETYDIQ
jgi:hypothetical protein